MMITDWKPYLKDLDHLIKSKKKELVKLGNEIKKLEKRRRELSLYIHVERWSERGVDINTQIKRIDFILKNKARHPKLVPEPLVDTLEWAKALLERRAISKMIESHVERWSKQGIDLDTQIKRIDFILRNKERHPKLVPEPLVDSLEKTKTQLKERAIRSYLEE